MFVLPNGDIVPLNAKFILLTTDKKQHYGRFMNIYNLVVVQYIEDDTIVLESLIDALGSETNAKEIFERKEVKNYIKKVHEKNGELIFSKKNSFITKMMNGFYIKRDYVYFFIYIINPNYIEKNASRLKINLDDMKKEWLN